MKLGLILGYSGKHISLPMDYIKHAENLGFDSVWTAEAYGSDAVSPAAWILAQTSKIRVGTAIMQIPARTPAMAAMTAMTLAQLSNNRFIMGLGASGPQVVEGWHGQPYGKALTRTREYVEIIRKIFARNEAATYEGEIYQMPYKGADSVGLGKPLKSILEANASIPIYSASITPGGVRTAAELCDGFFPVWMDPEKFHVFEKNLNEGFAKAGTGKSLDQFDVAPFVTAIMDDNIDNARLPIKQHLALYIGGMGARGKNFYTDYAIALGYADAAKVIQDLYLDGKKDDAARAVPDALVDAVALVGPKEHIRERLTRWKAAGAKKHVTSMLIGTFQKEVMELLAEEIL
jgi:F420-dependent oxidoreductase-like protein